MFFCVWCKKSYSWNRRGADYETLFLLVYTLLNVNKPFSNSLKETSFPAFLQLFFHSAINLHALGNNNQSITPSFPFEFSPLVFSNDDGPKFAHLPLSQANGEGLVGVVYGV